MVTAGAALNYLEVLETGKRTLARRMQSVSGESPLSVAVMARFGGTHFREARTTATESRKHTWVGKSVTAGRSTPLI